ncbi:MAG TPA: hypothetical protein IAA29_13270 [Candidatus Paenibacillus intestinavium]|nr:hypothetical protein [Candidatus Paenibacillus intestinavium]
MTNALNKVSVEYLIKWDNKTCNLQEKKDLYKMLALINKVKLKNDCIWYEEVYIECEFTVIKQNIVIINFFVDIVYLNNLEKFTREYKKVLYSFIKLERMEMTWDGVSSHYATIAYPLINRVENKMRGLINKFMTINSGVEWSSMCTPKLVKDSIKRREDRNENNPYLHSFDFIHLIDFLLKKYAFKSSDELSKFINGLDDASKLSKEDFESYLDVSNWDRYFKQYINVDSAKLEKVWKELYSFRCLIAHNSALSKKDVERVELLCREVEEIVEEASSKLIQINLTKYERDNLLVTSKKIYIDDYGKYELECGINKMEETIYVKNLMNEKIVSGKFILLEEGMDLVDADNLHIQCADREFGCFNGAIYDNYDNPEWRPKISIDELYDEAYEFLHRVIRFKHGDLDDDELFHVDQEWIDNPST